MPGALPLAPGKSTPLGRQGQPSVEGANITVARHGGLELGSGWSAGVSWLLLKWHLHTAWKGMPAAGNCSNLSAAQVHAYSAGAPQHERELDTRTANKLVTLLPPQSTASAFLNASQGLSCFQVSCMRGTLEPMARCCCC